MLDQITIDLSRFDWQGVSAVTDLLMVMLNVILIISVIVGYKSLRQSGLSRDARGSTFYKCWNQLEFWVKHKRIKNGEAMELADGGYSRKDFEVFALGA